MALGIGYGLPFVAQYGTNPYKTQWAAALQGAKGAGASVEDENAGTGSCLVARGQDVYTDGLPFTPSLLIVPQFYKDGNLYQDVPPFVAEDSTMRFTVSRNTTATRVNSSGLIESVASGVPRIDWLGQSCPALLVEASGQNLAWHSETWASGNNWELSQGGIARVTRATGSTSAFLAPDGTFTANALSPTSGNVLHNLLSNSSTSVSFTSGTIYTQSAFFKAGTGNAGRYVQLTYIFARFTQAGFANFDLQDGVVTLVTGTNADANRNARIENYGNGWYRCSFTATCDSGGSTFGVQPILITASGATRAATFAGTVTDVLYGWGAQLEAGSVATTYIPTTSGAVSRAADVISASGALVSGLIGQTEGTIYAEVDVRILGDGRFASVSDGTTNNRIQCRFNTANNGVDFVVVVSGASAGFSISNSTHPSFPATISAGTYKIALGYKQNDYVVAMNGVAYTPTVTTRNVPLNFSKVTLGADVADLNQFNNRIRSAALYTTRLSNDQLAELTRL